MDTMSEKTLKICLVIISLLFIWVTVLLGKKSDQHNKQQLVIQNLENQIDSLIVQKDSLYWELFPVQVELGRFQVAYEIFLERNPVAAKQYGTIISEETE